jgi:hypothetical protein
MFEEILSITRRHGLSSVITDGWHINILDLSPFINMASQDVALGYQLTHLAIRCLAFLDDTSIYSQISSVINVRKNANEKTQHPLVFLKLQTCMDEGAWRHIMSSAFAKPCCLFFFLCELLEYLHGDALRRSLMTEHVSKKCGLERQQIKARAQKNMNGFLRKAQGKLRLERRHSPSGAMIQAQRSTYMHPK